MLKELSKKDVQDILELHKRSIVPIWEKAGREYSWEEVEEYVNNTFKEGKVFGYLENDRLVGCIGIVLDEKSRTGRVRHVLVDEEYQNKGIGRKMIKKVEKFSKDKVKDLRLSVLHENDALKFYEKQGFNKYAYIMKKEL